MILHTLITLIKSNNFKWVPDMPHVQHNVHFLSKIGVIPSFDFYQTKHNQLFSINELDSTIILIIVPLVEKTIFSNNL